MHLKHKMSMALAAALAMAASPGIHAATHAGRGAPAGRTTQGLVAAPTTCDPFADWDFEVDGDGSGGSNGGDDSTTSKLLPTLSQSPGSSVAHRGLPDFHGMDSAARVIGTTPEAIERNFLQVVTRNLANAGTRSRVARLSDQELRAIARHAAHGASAERAGLLKLFATRLDAASLVRVARAFGRAPVEAAVHAYADPQTREAFDVQVVGLVASPPDDEGGGGGDPSGGGTTPYPSPSPPRPTVDMTLEEIYLEFRTAPVGSLSPAGALSETAQFAGVRLTLAYGTGYWIGSQISALIQYFAPELDNAIGATISTMLDDFWAASGEVQQGHFEAAFDELFGFPVTTGSDPWGDWDISAPMVDYYQYSGTCLY